MSKTRVCLSLGSVLLSAVESGAGRGEYLEIFV